MFTVIPILCDVIIYVAIICLAMMVIIAVGAAVGAADTQMHDNCYMHNRDVVCNGSSGCDIESCSFQGIPSIETWDSSFYNVKGLFGKFFCGNQPAPENDHCEAFFQGYSLKTAIDAMVHSSPYIIKAKHLAKEQIPFQKSFAQRQKETIMDWPDGNSMIRKRHKLGAALIAAIIDTKPLAASCKEDQKKFLGNYVLALDCTLLFLNDRIRNASNGYLADNLNAFYFPSTDVSYYKVFIRSLYCADMDGALNLYDIAECLFHLECITLEHYEKEKKCAGIKKHTYFGKGMEQGDIK